MDNSIDHLLSAGKYSTIWKTIAEGRLEYARAEIAKNIVIPKKSLFGFLKNKPGQNDIVLLVASDILESTPGERLSKIKLLIEKEGSDQFAELVRLLFALQRNGRFTAAATLLLEKILELLGYLAEQVSVQAGDYPNHSIKAFVWAGGYTIREMCVPLTGYFDQVNDLNNKAYVLQIRCKITLSIMSHYPHSVGPDMIELALAMEAIGITDLANNYYNAVIADFERIADEIRISPEEEVLEEQIITLTSLKQAYENSNRLNNTLRYTDELQFVNAVIEKGVVRVSDDDEEAG